MAMKMRLKMKNSSPIYNIDLGLDMNTDILSIKYKMYNKGYQHLSNIWRWIHEKDKQNGIYGIHH